MEEYPIAGRAEGVSIGRATIFIIYGMIEAKQHTLIRPREDIRTFVQEQQHSGQ